MMLPALARAAAPVVIPQPAHMTVGEGTFKLSPSTSIRLSGGSPALVLQAARLLNLTPADEKAELSIAVNPALAELGDEGYRLAVAPAGISITARTEAGAYYALQTLRQLGPADVYSGKPLGEVPCVAIEDQPRYKWRGMMLDCSRHFWPKEFVKKFIDLEAAHKLNVFHWHLTDDQGWRIEIKRYPKLTEVGAWREQTLIGHPHKDPSQDQYDGVRHGGFYTQDDIREVVAYAAERHITVVPEIEMPGHSRAAIASYPELSSSGKPVEVSGQWGVEKNIVNPFPSTVEFYKNVLAEVVELFPGPYVHIGGDEATKDQWRASPQIQAQMKELGITDPDAMQAWFVRQIAQFLDSKGKRFMGWDEILEGGAENLPRNTTVMAWRGASKGVEAAHDGFDAVMAPTSHTYFDHYQSKDAKNEPMAIGGFLPIDRVYSFDPVIPELTPEQAKHILGGQAQIWTEYIPTTNQVEYMAFPREAALAEALWSPASEKDYADFSKRLPVHLERLAKLGVHFRPLDPEPATTQPK